MVLILPLLLGKNYWTVQTIEYETTKLKICAWFFKNVFYVHPLGSTSAVKETQLLYLSEFSAQKKIDLFLNHKGK